MATYNVSLQRYNGSSYDELLPKNTIQGTSAPTTSTVGVVGQFYLNTTARVVYVCFAAGSTYTWLPCASLSDDTPQPLGTASAGTSLKSSRADHRHALPSLATLGAQKAITSGTSTPSGGSNGDIYIQY